MNDFFSTNNQGASEKAANSTQQSQQPAIEQTTADVIEMFKNVREEPDTTTGWGIETIPGKAIEINIDAGTKLKPWLEKYRNVNLQLRKLKAPTQYGATHRCEVLGEASGPPGNVDHLNKVLTAVRGRSGFDGLIFTVSPETVIPYIVKTNKRIGLKLTIAVKDGSVLVIGH